MIRSNESGQNVKIFWLILQYNMAFKKWWKKHCANLKEKKPSGMNSPLRLHVSLSMILFYLFIYFFER